MSVALAPPDTLLDAALPELDFNEVHSREIAAPPEVTWDAFRAVKPLEVRTLAPLMAIRELPVLLSGKRPKLGFSYTLLEEFLGVGFIELGSRPGEEFAAGAIGRWWNLGGNQPLPIESTEEFVAFNEPGYAKAAISFTFEPSEAGTLVQTETRIAGTDPEATRHFGRYWWVIKPWSGLIRISWLNAIRRRAARL